MIVKEKQTDIAILRTIGAAPVNVLRMFLVQGALIGLVGTRGGRRARLARCRATSRPSCSAIERAFGVQFLDAARVFHERPARRGAHGDVLQVSLVVAAARGARNYLPGLARVAHAAGGGSAT